LLGGYSLAPPKTRRYCEAIGVRWEDAASVSAVPAASFVVDAPGNLNGSGRAV
jgi:hypothetical protein